MLAFGQCVSSWIVCQPLGSFCDTDGRTDNGILGLGCSFFFSQSIRDWPETSSHWYETKPPLCYILPHLGLGIHNRYYQISCSQDFFVNWSHCSGLVPVVCLIFLNTKISLAMKKLRFIMDYIFKLINHLIPHSYFCWSLTVCWYFCWVCQFRSKSK